MFVLSSPVKSHINRERFRAMPMSPVAQHRKIGLINDREPHFVFYSLFCVFYVYPIYLFCMANDSNQRRATRINHGQPVATCVLRIPTHRKPMLNDSERFPTIRINTYQLKTTIVQEADG